MDEQKLMESRCLCWKSKLALVHTGGVGRARWLLGWSAAALRVSTQAALLLQCCNAQLYLSARTLLLITINNDESMVLLCPRSERVERWGGEGSREKSNTALRLMFFSHLCHILQTLKMLCWCDVDMSVHGSFSGLFLAGNRTCDMEKAGKTPKSLDEAPLESRPVTQGDAAALTA